jgi:hypothetical protein
VTASHAQLELGHEEHGTTENIDLRFSRWLGEHPKALRDFAEIARELVAAGETRLSAKFIVEIARYRQIIRKDEGERYALNNTFTSRIARALDSIYPELSGRFELRELA